MKLRNPALLFDLFLILCGLVMVGLLFSAMFGCSQVAERAAIAATDRAISQLGIPAPPPGGDWESLVAALGATVAVIGHRYFFHRRNGGDASRK